MWKASSSRMACRQPALRSRSRLTPSASCSDSPPSRTSARRVSAISSAPVRTQSRQTTPPRSGCQRVLSSPTRLAAPARHASNEAPMPSRPSRPSSKTRSRSAVAPPPRPAQGIVQPVVDRRLGVSRRAQPIAQLDGVGGVRGAGEIAAQPQPRLLHLEAVERPSARAPRSRSSACPHAPSPSPPPKRLTLLRAPRASAETRPVVTPSNVTTRSASP